MHVHVSRRTSHAANPGVVAQTQNSQGSHPEPKVPDWSVFVTMTSGFIGISVIVTLQNPPNTLVHGVVAAVNPQNATLTLQDGTFSCFDTFLFCLLTVS